MKEKNGTDPILSLLSIPPHDPQIENEILGTILLFPETLPEVMENLSDIGKEAFYLPETTMMYKALVDMHQKGKAIDATLLYKHLKAAPFRLKLGAELIDSLTKGPTFKESLGDKLKELRREYQKRQVWRILSNQIASIPNGEDPREIIASTVESLSKIEIEPSGIEKAIMQFKDFCGLDLPEKAKILDPWIQEQGIILISGWRGVGKTWFALSILDSITRGLPFGPWSTKKAVPCLYLDAEMAAADMRLRWQQINPEPEVIEPLYIYSGHLATMANISPPDLGSPDWQRAMKKVLIEKDIKLWVVDNLSSVTPGLDENAKSDWDIVNRWLIELRHSGVTTILVHHVGKEGTQRGTSSREDNIDISVELEKPEGYFSEEGARFIAKFTKHRIPQEDLTKIVDMEFQLTAAETVGLTWTWVEAKKKKKTEIIKLLKLGMSNKEIAEAANSTASNVSKVKAEAIRDGVLDPGEKEK